MEIVVSSAAQCSMEPSCLINPSLSQQYTRWHHAGWFGKMEFLSYILFPIHTKPVLKSCAGPAVSHVLSCQKGNWPAACPGGQGFSNTTTIQVPGRRGSSTSAPRRCRRYRTRGLSRMPLGKDTTGFGRLFSAYKVKLCSSIVKPPDGNSQEALTTTGNQVNRHGITTRRTPGGSKDGE